MLSANFKPKTTAAASRDRQHGFLQFLVIVSSFPQYQHVFKF